MSKAVRKVNHSRQLGHKMLEARRKLKSNGVLFSARLMGLALKVERQTVARWESGEVMPQWHRLEDYCEELIKKGLGKDAAQEIFAFGYPGRILRSQNNPASFKGSDAVQPLRAEMGDHAESSTGEILIELRALRSQLVRAPRSKIGRVKTEPTTIEGNLPLSRRLSGNYPNRDWVCVHVRLHPDYRFDETMKDRLRKIASGFGKPIEVTELDSEKVQIELYVLSGRGFTQHLNTLERDLKRLPFVRDVSDISAPWR
jgi:hypothetical protein